MAATNGYDVVGGIASSLIDFAGSSIMANSANAKNKRAQERANWFNVYNWQLQNEYNLPKNQIKRLLDANLNPSMIYDKGAGDLSSGTISSPGSYNAYSGKGSMKILENIAAVNAIKKQNKDIDRVSAEINSIDETIAQNWARINMEQEMLPVRIALLTAQAFNQNQLGHSTEISNAFYDMLNESLGGLDTNKDSLSLAVDFIKALGSAVINKKERR